MEETLHEIFEKPPPQATDLWGVSQKVRELWEGLRRYRFPFERVQVVTSDGHVVSVWVKEEKGSTMQMAKVEGETGKNVSTETRLANPIKKQTVISNKGKTIDITPSANHSTTTSVPHPSKGVPNSSVDILDKKTGEIKTRRYYDSNGRAVRDVDFTNHGNAKQHPEWPHEHIFEWNDDGTFKRIP